MTRLWTAVVLLGAAAAPAAVGDDGPDSGTFTGYYRVDRWGGHRFHGLAVEPPARAAFDTLHDTLVSAEVKKIDRTSNPGKRFLASVGKVTRVTDAPVEVRVTWADGPIAYRRGRPGTPLRFTVAVTNRLARPLDTTTLQVIGFYTQGIGDGISGTFGDAPGTLQDIQRALGEWRHPGRVIAAGASVTQTVTAGAPVPGEYELGLFVRVIGEPDRPAGRTVESNWLRLDVLDDRPRPADGPELDLLPEPNPPRPPRPVPAKIVVRNPRPRPLNFYLPYRGTAVADDQLLRCFDAAGTMVKGPRQPATVFDLGGPRDLTWKAVKLGPGRSMTLDVVLPSDTALAAAELLNRQRSGNPTPDEDYYTGPTPSRSRYVVIQP